MNQEDSEQKYAFKSKKNDKNQSFDFIKKIKNQKNVKQQFLSFFTILSWLPTYSIKQNFYGDVITGITVGIMVVPQGMAYASLAGVTPIQGLYSCFFSALIYMFFGTSWHVSVGTFAVASIMIGNIQNDLMDDLVNIKSKNVNASLTNNVNKQFDFELTPIVITSTLTFFVGVFQFFMGLFRLSFITNFLSDPLVSGFTTGSAVHVLYSQLDKALGIKIKRQSGINVILKKTLILATEISKTNFWTLGIFLFGFFFLYISRQYINPYFVERYRIPLPFELILVIISTFFSKFFEINVKHNVDIISHIPQGFAKPSLPKFILFPYLWLNAILLSIICYIFLFSMAKIFAKKHKYKIDSNQELFALGISQILSSFFPVYPSGVSLSRSSLCELTGAKTQLHALFSSLLLLIVILWFGPFLESLPMATLSSIVVISLKSLFLQFKDLLKLWTVSKIDFIIWLITFLSTVLINVQFGLIIGLIFVIFSVVLREHWPKVLRLYATPNKNLSGSTEFHENLINVSKLDKIIILKFEAPLHFANTTKFVEQCVAMFAEINKKNVNQKSNCCGILIIDISSISFVDSSGIDAFIEVYEEGKKSSVDVYFAQCGGTVLQMLKKCKFFKIVPQSNFFLTLHEAFLNAEKFIK